MNSVSCKIQKAIYQISSIFAEKKKMQSPLLKQRARNNNRKREQWRPHTNRRRHPRKANGLKALLKCPYYQSKFRVNVISTHKALVFFTKQKKEDGNGVTRLLFQHLGTGSRRQIQPWLHPAYEVSLGYTREERKRKKNETWVVKVF